MFLPGHKASSGTFSPEGLAGGEALDVLATAALPTEAFAGCCCICLGGTWSVDAGAHKVVTLRLFLITENSECIETKSQSLFLTCFFFEDVNFLL